MTAPVALGRWYFGLQSVAGAAWWVAVFLSADVRAWTLGGWDPVALVGPDLLLFVGASGLAAALGSRIAAVVAATWTTSMTVALCVYGLVERTAGWGCVSMTVATVGSVAAAATIWFGHLPTQWFFVGPFSFRVADEASGAHHLRRSLVQLVVFWTTFFVALPLALAWVETRLGLTWSALDGGWTVLGAALFLAASVLGVWSCVAMALVGNGTPLPSQTARDLVIVGPYRRVRNPMAVAGALQTVGIGIWVGSWTVVAIGVAGAVVWNVVIRPEEEADMAARFGEAYERYTEQVRCWVPISGGRRTSR